MELLVEDIWNFIDNLAEKRDARFGKGSGIPTVVREDVWRDFEFYRLRERVALAL